MAENFIQAVKQLGWWNSYSALKNLLDAQEILKTHPIGDFGICVHIEKLLSCAVCYPAPYVVETDRSHDQLSGEVCSHAEKVDLSALYHPVEYLFTEPALSDDLERGNSIQPVQSLLQLYTAAKVAAAIACKDGEIAWVGDDFDKIKARRDALAKAAKK